MALARIKKSPLYREWADKYLMFLENNIFPENDDNLKAVMGRMIKFDEPKDEALLIRMTNAARYDYEGLFTRLLRRDKNNKAAFEYLMSYYLLTGQTGKVVENIRRLDDFGYKGLPRYYQEALAVYMFEPDNSNPEFYAGRIDPAVLKRYRYFYNLYRKYNYDKIAAYNALKDKYADSYFLYYIMLAGGKKDVR